MRDVQVEILVDGLVLDQYQLVLWIGSNLLVVGARSHALKARPVGLDAVNRSQHFSKPVDFGLLNIHRLVQLLNSGSDQFFDFLLKHGPNNREKLLSMVGFDFFLGNYFVFLHILDHVRKLELLLPLVFEDFAPLLVRFHEDLSAIELVLLGKHADLVFVS